MTVKRGASGLRAGCLSGRVRMFVCGIMMNRFLMIKILKIVLCIASVCVACYVAGMYLLLACKVLCGRAIVLQKSGCLKSVVSGRSIDCPYFIVCKETLPRNLGQLHAFQIGTNSVTVALRIDGDVYWLDGASMGITRCSSIGDTCFVLDRWAFLSETALNLTYDVKNNMKGLKHAEVHVTDEIDNRVYKCTFKDKNKLAELVVRIPGNISVRKGVK